MQVDGECSNRSDTENEESPICMQVGTSEESSSSDTESEEERPDSEDVHNGNKNKDMSEHTYKGLSSGERKTADTPLVVRHMSPILNWLCIHIKD